MRTSKLYFKKQVSIIDSEKKFLSGGKSALIDGVLLVINTEKDCTFIAKGIFGRYIVRFEKGISRYALMYDNIFTHGLYQNYNLNDIVLINKNAIEMFLLDSNYFEVYKSIQEPFPLWVKDAASFGMSKIQIASFINKISTDQELISKYNIWRHNLELFLFYEQLNPNGKIRPEDVPDEIRNKFNAEDYKKLSLYSRSGLKEIFSDNPFKKGIEILNNGKIIHI